MKKILLNLIGIITVLVFANSVNAQGIIISEVADGTGSGGYPKFIELTNTTTSDFVLDGYKINVYVNGSTSASEGYVFTTYTLAAGESLVITNIDNATSGQLWTDFGLTTPTNVIHSATSINSNGDDVYELTDGSDNPIDVYGVIGVDGSGESWEFLDSYAYRVASVQTPTTTFNPAEWSFGGVDALDGLSADLSPYLTPGTHNTSSGPNTEANIVSFELAEQYGSATISAANQTVDIQVVNGTDLSSLTPTIGVSLNATINPASGVAQNFTSAVTYTVTAEDGTTAKDWIVTVTEAAAVETVTIYDIQYTTTGESSYKDSVVTTTGVVTSLHYNYEGGTYKGYFIQDGDGPWNGVYVYDNTHTPVVGDNVTITGTVTEYLSTTLTVTEFVDVTVFTINSSGNTLPTPSAIETGSMDESYEGVLISLANAECTSAPDTYGVWEVNSNSTGGLKVDDDIFDYTPTVGTQYNMTGIGFYSYGEYKILPRDAADVTAVGVAEISNNNTINVYPNPAENMLYVSSNSDVHVSITNIAGQQVMTANTNTLDVSSLTQGVYFVNVVDAEGNTFITKLMKK